MRITGIAHGHYSLVMEVADHAGESYEQWYPQAIAALTQLNENEGLAVTLPIDESTLVESGVPCQYQGKSFEVWSDRPGEIVVVFGTLRPRQSEQLLAAIQRVWSP